MSLVGIGPAQGRLLPVPGKMCFLQSGEIITQAADFFVRRLLLPYVITPLFIFIDLATNGIMIHILNFACDFA